MSTAFDNIKPFPSPSLQTAPIGHNRPPLDESVVAEFMEGLKADAGLLVRVEQLVTRGNAAGPCTDTDLAGRYGDFIRMAGEAVKRIEAEREKHNRPLLTAQRTLKTKADAITAPLVQASNNVRRQLDAFMAEERRKEVEARRQAEEQARIAREAAAAEARRQAEERGADPDEVVVPAVEIEATPVEAPVARGDYGARVGTTTKWRHEIISVRQLPDRILKHPKVVEALEKVVGAEVRGGAREIKGCRIWDDQVVSVR